MISAGNGNLLKAKAEAYVNTVNTVGIMGKGIALQFKRAFPDNYQAYAAASKAHEVQIGRMFVFERRLLHPRLIINFPTKRHWKEKSHIEYIRAGLEDLVRVVREHDVRSIAIPPLGCGHGGLNWAEVRPLIVEAFEALPEVTVLLFAPDNAPEALEMPNASKSVQMTRWRALMIRLIDIYLAPDYFLGRVEAMKLAYFIQVAGQDMKLKFEARQFGPYSDAVIHALDSMEGTFIEGLGDRSGRSQIQLRPGALEAAEAFLDQDLEAQRHLAEVATLIEGFETSYTMELLASVHWVAVEQEAQNWEEALQLVGKWTPRKRKMMQPHHVKVAWEQLEEFGWLGRRATQVRS